MNKSLTHFEGNKLGLRWLLPFHEVPVFFLVCERRARSALRKARFAVFHL